ncbi:P44/Msp2 family outer membrane protein [Wolbachia endosymbiont of Madathamugadia hiepei]|uniref:P44/Msp2 family outer membrane protein n=1 Tax=Wolbachia endosymbiont of Madathamugadia hiepei TaxID=1241303 RepID=UPI00158869F1|nr:P44/Msp2 family outer membrane protein [Wolbachia endosymbiont of Madathamugadia hiepei]NUX00994.1 P44/Msp2 family outer membrane protein [Wolbachia endosymbiont of Madathamugadia hiepei]
MMKRSTVFDALIILCISFFSAQANAGDVEDLMLADKLVCHKSRKYDEKEATSVKDKRLNFYISANGGKIYHDNSETCMNGIKAIGERVLTLVENRFGSIMKNIVAGEIKSIQQFNGKIDFQWLSSISVGYYARENGRIDFEAMYSGINIEGGDSPAVFDRSASIFAFLLNFYYNLSIQDTQFAPYIGLGIGPTVFRFKKVNGSPKNSMPLNVPWFAYQVKLGVNYSIIPEVKAFLGYRYFSIPIPVADDISTHNVEIGLMFSF